MSFSSEEGEPAIFKRRSVASRIPPSLRDFHSRYLNQLSRSAEKMSSLRHRSSLKLFVRQISDRCWIPQHKLASALSTPKSKVIVKLTAEPMDVKETV